MTDPLYVLMQKNVAQSHAVTFGHLVMMTDRLVTLMGMLFNSFALRDRKGVMLKALPAPAENSSIL